MSLSDKAFLSGKTALVTGGSRGIGAAIVRRLAAEGAQVAFTYSGSQEKAAALAGETGATAIRADSASVADIQAAAARTAETFGRIDILISNAGILIPGVVDTYDLADFDRMIAINVRAPFVAVQAVLPHMGDGGRILTIGSIVADYTGFPGASVYSLTKGAVAAMTRGLARDLGPRNITVNALQPGPTISDMSPAEALSDRLAPLIPLGRMAQPEEIANFAAWLAGPESSFVTGACLTADGGITA
jgi:3-oxoacyl-[acyl-carrier protein] reductase